MNIHKKPNMMNSWVWIDCRNLNTSSGCIWLSNCLDHSYSSSVAFKFSLKMMLQHLQQWSQTLHIDSYLLPYWLPVWMTVRHCTTFIVVHCECQDLTISGLLNKFLRKKKGKVRRPCAASGCLVHGSMRVKLSKFPDPTLYVWVGYNFRREKQARENWENRWDSRKSTNQKTKMLM